MLLPRLTSFYGPWHLCFWVAFVSHLSHQPWHLCLGGRRRICQNILSQDDKQKVGGKSFVKKSGWRKLAMVFDISFEIRYNLLSQFLSLTHTHTLTHRHSPSLPFSPPLASSFPWSFSCSFFLSLSLSPPSISLHFSLSLSLPLTLSLFRSLFPPPPHPYRRPPPSCLNGVCQDFLH